MNRRLDRLPEANPELGALYAHINRMTDVIESLIPRTSHKTLTAWTSAGVTRQSLGGTVEESTDQPVWLP